MNIIVVILVLPDNRPVDFIICLVYSLNVLLYILDDSLYLLLKLCYSLIDESYRPFHLDSLIQYIVVTFVLFEF